MPSKAKTVALRTAGIYTVAAAAWILLTDRLLYALLGPGEALGWAEVYKGWLFVLVTGAILYLAVRSQMVLIERAAAARLKTEADLRRQSERLQLAVSAGNVALWDFDLQSGEAFFSPEWKRQLGLLDDDVENRVDEWKARLHPADYDLVLKTVGDFVRSPTGVYHQEYRLRHKDGSYRWMLSQGAALRDAEGNATHILGCHVDITPMKQAEEALRQRAEVNALLEHIAAVVPGVIIAFHRRLDGSVCFPYASPAIEDVYGVKAADVEHDGAPVFERLHPDDLALVASTIEQSARGMSAWRCEFRYRHPRKGVIWIEGFSLPERQEDGSIRWNGFVMDVTSRKLTELKLRKLNRLYSVLSAINQAIVRGREKQSLFDAVCTIAIEKGGFKLAWIGRLDATAGNVQPLAQAGAPADYVDSLETATDAALVSALPATRAALSGEHVVCNDIEHDPLAGPWREQALARGFSSCGAFPFRVHGGTPGVLSLYSTELDVFDPSEVQLLDEMATDLSFAVEVAESEAVRLRVEATLRENEERFRQLAENISEVFWLSEQGSGRILYVSPVYEKLTGRSVKALYANPREWGDNVHPEDRERVEKAVKQAIQSAEYDEEYRFVRADGAIRWVRSRAFPVRDASGAMCRIAGITEDVTDRKQLEDQFFRAQRLEAIGTLASGIAHDLNNILAPIMMCAPLLRMGLPAAEFEKMLGTIESSTRRGADLVRQLLVFGRGIEGGRGPVAPKELVLEIQKIATETFPKNISVRTEVKEPVWMIVGDATQLHQVLLNLCVNARDAMPDGGELTISVDNVQVDPRSQINRPSARPGAYVRLRVRDTGTGISPEHVEKIFDPFFTTKPPGKGTGLGLSTVLGIVKSHGGFVNLETKIGSGSSFDVYLPAQVDDARPEGPQAAIATMLGHGELVLLVDDEQSIREVVRDILTRHNYQVLMAEDGVEAEQLLRENLKDTALLLTDLDMPRMDGMRLVETARKLRPGLPVIVSTGLRSGRLQERGKELDAAGVTAVLSKPYGTPELLSAVYSALSV